MQSRRTYEPKAVSPQTHLNFKQNSSSNTSPPPQSYSPYQTTLQKTTKNSLLNQIVSNRNESNQFKPYSPIDQTKQNYIGAGQINCNYNLGLNSIFQRQNTQGNKENYSPNLLQEKNNINNNKIQLALRNTPPPQKEIKNDLVLNNCSSLASKDMAVQNSFTSVQAQVNQNETLKNIQQSPSLQKKIMPERTRQIHSSIANENDIKCENHETKKAKYMTTNETPSRYFCSKCALSFVSLGKKVIEIKETEEQKYRRIHTEGFLSNIKKVQPRVDNLKELIKSSQELVVKNFDSVIKDINDFEVKIINEIQQKCKDLKQFALKVKETNLTSLSQISDNISIIQLETQNMFEDVNSNKANIIFNIEQEPFKKIMDNYNLHLGEFSAALVTLEQENVIVCKFGQDQLNIQAQIYNFIQNLVLNTKKQYLKTNEFNKTNQSSNSLYVSFENKEIFQQQINEERKQRAFRSLFCEEGLEQQKVEHKIDQKMKHSQTIEHAEVENNYEVMLEKISTEAVCSPFFKQV